MKTAPQMDRGAVVFPSYGMDYGVAVGEMVTTSVGVEVATPVGVAEMVLTGVGDATKVGVDCASPASRICQAISRSSLAATGKFGRFERVRSRRRRIASSCIP